VEQLGAFIEKSDSKQLFDQRNISMKFLSLPLIIRGGIFVIDAPDKRGNIS
jgi:hypothetical protein